MKAQKLIVGLLLVASATFVSCTESSVSEEDALYTIDKDEIKEEDTLDAIDRDEIKEEDT